MGEPRGTERQVTNSTTNHVLTNVNVWSNDGNWIYYDVRSDAAGEVFDGRRIERVHVDSGRTEIVYQSQGDGCVGVVTASPTADQVIFIHGPDNPTDDWKYCAWHRRGVIVTGGRSATAVNMDARDLTPPFTAGALRGGSHVHTFSPDGKWIAFTYEDHVLAEFVGQTPHELNQRAVGVSVPANFLPSGSVVVDATHPRNHSGTFFSVLVTLTHDRPRPGSDEICRAVEDAWIGREGYIRSDGERQRRAIAFQGEVVSEAGHRHREVFVVDIPEDLTLAGRGPLAGTTTTRPSPPRGVVQRRLTRTSDRRYPGVQGPRHWLRSSPDGARIAFLMKDESGVVQIWIVSPSTSTMRQLTHNSNDIASAFTWSADGRWIAHAMDTSICVTDTASGETIRLTTACTEWLAPRPEACVFSPGGDQIAYVRRVPNRGNEELSPASNQIFVLSLARDTG